MGAVDWHGRAQALAPDGRAFVDGARRDAVGGNTFAKHSPIDGRALGPVARCRAADVDAAVASARTAFDDGRWAAKSPAQRKKILQRFADAILGAKDELALLETLDMGKPIRYSLSVDVPSTARTIAWYAEAIDKVYDEIAPTPANALALITREPMGVVGWPPATRWCSSRARSRPTPRCGSPNWRSRPACRRGSSTSCPGMAAKPARRSHCIRTSTRSASPAARASDAACSSTPAAAT
jgi:hypothetical protein